MQLKRLKSANELVNCIIEKQLINPESRDKTNKFCRQVCSDVSGFYARYYKFAIGLQ